MSHWLESLREAGAFVPAAKQFVARFSSGDVPAGLDGLRVLAVAIDRFAESGEPADDDAFLEGAGALLAAIVIERHRGRARHGEREGRHRLLLGSHGASDPFAAVARALNGDARARPTLVNELSLIEAEIEGTGPVARMARAFEEALATRRPELSVLERFDREVLLSDETRVDLGQAIDATSDGSLAAVAQAADKLVAILPGGAASLGLADVEPALRPRLIGPSFTGAEVHAVPFRGELRIALVILREGRARFVLPADLLRWDADPDRLLHRALDNLAASSASAKVKEEGPLLMLRSGDGCDSARLLLPGLCETMAPALGAPFLVGVPHRDVLWLAPEAERDTLAARVADEHARAPHRISDALYRVDAGGISLV